MTDELHKRKAELFSEINNSSKRMGIALSNMTSIADESLRVADVAHNAKNIIEDYDAKFESQTSLSTTDVAFMFTTIGLLCAKWFIMGQVAPLDFDFKHDPNERERIDHEEGDKKAEDKQKEAEDKEKGNYDDKSERGFRTISQIFECPVPYDSMAVEKNTLSGALGSFASMEPPRRFYVSSDIHSFTMTDGSNYPLCGKNHRAYTLGHDPILGWIFGTVNIMSRRMTLKSPLLKTFSVKCDKGEGNKVSDYSDFCSELVESFQSFTENNRRLPVAVAKQGIHFLADKYSKTGLPIPFLSAEKAQELIEKGWNSVEAAAAIKKVLAKAAKNTAIIGLQFVISFLINEIIKAVHLLLYDKDRDGDIKLYQVRTRKILLTANCVASSSNVLYCALFGAVTKDPISAAKKLDIGGFIETIHRLVSDTKFINDVKLEFVIGNFYKLIQNNADEEWEIYM